MSDEEADRLRAEVPDDPIRLQDHFLACRTCGVAVRIDSEAEVILLQSLGRAVEGVASITMAASENQQPIPLTSASAPRVATWRAG